MLIAQNGQGTLLAGLPLVPHCEHWGWSSDSAHGHPRPLVRFDIISRMMLIYVDKLPRLVNTIFWYSIPRINSIHCTDIFRIHCGCKHKLLYCDKYRSGFVLQQTSVGQDRWMSRRAVRLWHQNEAHWSRIASTYCLAQAQRLIHWQCTLEGQLNR